MRAEKILTSSKKFHIELGLARISKVLELLGHPERGLKFIHVAGSNGKGSTCAILEEILMQAGFKTGKFTSPHLFSYTERITVNKRPIDDLAFDKLIGEISKLDCDHKIELTEFEILTAAAFLYFAQNRCDVVVLEVGLGGRLDSTNVIEHPLVSIVTSVSLEHTERLGDTLEKIAKEKAGIFKKGSPAVFLTTNRAFETLKAEAESKGAPVFTAEPVTVRGGYAILEGGAARGENGCENRGEGRGESCKSAGATAGEGSVCADNRGVCGVKRLKFNLNGAFQGENLALALKAVEILNGEHGGSAFDKIISENAVKTALERVQWKFRLEKRNINGASVLIDACHNPDGARVLREYLDENYRGCKIKFIFGCLKNKDHRRVLENLLEDCDGKISADKTLCFYEFNYPNALKYEDLDPKFKAAAVKITDPYKYIWGACRAIGGGACRGIDMCYELSGAGQKSSSESCGTESSCMTGQTDINTQSDCADGGSHAAGAADGGAHGDCTQKGYFGRDYDLTVVCGSIYMLGQIFKDKV